MNYTILSKQFDTKKLLSCLDIYKLSPMRQCTNIEQTKIQDLLQIPVSIHYIFYFQLKPLHISKIHIDKSLIDSRPESDFALNIPLHNCNNVYMDWFKASDEAKIKSYRGTPTNYNVPFLDPSEAIKIDTLQLNGPIIAKNDDWHSISNLDADSMAHLISIRFKPEIGRNYIESLFPPQ